MNYGTLLTAVATLLAGSGYAGSAEITTNGAGGGRWGDPATWRGNAVPGPGDDVVIRRGDVVVFDRNDDGKVSCRKLHIDPKGALTFQTEAGKKVCCVADEIDSYGILKLDATRSADDHLELRLVGEAARRTLKLQRGAALLVWGKAKLPGGRLNAGLFCPKGAKGKVVAGTAKAVAGVTVDLRHAAVTDLEVHAADIDNTGAQPSERFRIEGCGFTGAAQIFCHRCDTPVIAANTFHAAGPKRSADVAIRLVECPLAEVRGNAVRGGYQQAVVCDRSVDAVITGNSVSDCGVGIHILLGSHNIVRRNSVRGCDTGFFFNYAQNALLEDCSAEGCRTAACGVRATAQLTGLRVKDPPGDAVGVLYRESGALRLLNCDVRPGQVKLEKLLAPEDKAAPAPVTAMHYLVVKVRGAPNNARVELSTAKPKKPLPPGAADLNVRNSPAGLIEGMTPLPQSFNALVVRAWSVGRDGKTVPAPGYTLRVLAPTAQAGGTQRVLKEITVTPQASWYRPRPDAPTPTVEVTLP
jgi:parallel beta-helix repeat protein